MRDAEIKPVAHVYPELVSVGKQSGWRAKSAHLGRRALSRDFGNEVFVFRRARAPPSLPAPPRPTSVAMSLAEGQKALQTFHEWCDAQGIEYDKEVRLVSRAFRDAPHRRSRDGFSSAVPGVDPPPVRSPPTPSSSSTPTVTARPGAGDSRVRGRLLREPEPVPLRRVRAARHRGGRSVGSLHPQERVSQRANVVVRAAAPGGAAGRGARAEHRHHARALVTGKEQVARVLRRAPTPRRAHVTDVLAGCGVTNAARHGARRARRGGCALASRGLRRARRERAMRQVPGGVRSFTVRGHSARRE